MFLLISHICLLCATGLVFDSESVKTGGKKMILAFDTYYFDDKARTVCIEFNKWTDKEEYNSFSEITDIVAAYRSGEFYKRELPCITSLLKKIPLNGIEAIIVDGFTYLDDNNKLGLGGRLYEFLQEKIPVIGVAKTNFAALHKNKKLLYRGKTHHPLFINAAGMDNEKATWLIQKMDGRDRIPALLRKLDRMTRET